MLASRITLPHFSVSSTMSLSELARRAREHGGAPFFEARLHFGIGECRVDLLVELVDDLGRRVWAPRCRTMSLAS